MLLEILSTLIYTLLFVRIEFHHVSDRLVDSPTARPEPLLNSYSDYEDSVYGSRLNSVLETLILISKLTCFWEFTGLAWSSREPWIFASLSYDGRVSLLARK